MSQQSSQRHFPLLVKDFNQGFVEVTDSASPRVVFFKNIVGASLSVAGPLCAGMGGKKKKKMMYLTTKNAGTPHAVTASVFIQIGYYGSVGANRLLTDLVLEFDRHELRIYEEVAKVPPFRRKTLVLIGAQGVGRRSLKNKLMVSDPQRYGTTVPCECSHASCVTVDVAASLLPTFFLLLYSYIFLFHHLRLCVYFCLSVQSPPENQKLTRETARCTPS